MNRILTIILFLTSQVLVSQATPTFPETSEARRQSLDILFKSPELQVSQGPKFLNQGELNPRVKFEAFYQRDKTTEDGRPVYYFSFVPEENLTFVYGRRGHSVVKMDAATGKLESLKVFFQDTRLETTADLGQRTWGSFLLVTPREPKTVLSVYIEGQRVVMDIPLPYSMREILSTSVDQWHKAAEDYLDWEMVFPVHTYSADLVEASVQKARRLLVQVPEVEDGAQDEKGRWVYINTLALQTGPVGLNCSGLAKWFADGFYKPLMDRYLSILPLKARNLEIRGHVYTLPYDNPENLAKLRDPFFGLDWTRNIALSLVNALYPGKDWNLESQDVRENPFYIYTRTRGYKIEELDPILYYLAVKKPGSFYLGSVNGDFGAKPVLNQHRHVAIFFPWIDPWGVYKLAVFEVNQETSLSHLQKAYPNNYVHLVELPVVDGFDPPSLLFGREYQRTPDGRILLR